MPTSAGADLQGAGPVPPTLNFEAQILPATVTPLRQNFAPPLSQLLAPHL